MRNWHIHPSDLHSTSSFLTGDSYIQVEPLHDQEYVRLHLDDIDRIARRVVEILKEQKP